MGDTFLGLLLWCPPDRRTSGRDLRMVQTTFRRRDNRVLGRRRWVLFVALAMFVDSRAAWAGETTLAEPIIEENITDVDGTEVGTLELDATGLLLRPRGTGPGLWGTALEGEWRAVDRLGIGGELALGGTTSAFKPTSANVYTPRIAGSYVVFRDWERQLFLQAEASARTTFGDEPPLANLAESALPYRGGLRLATQGGPVTFRAGAFGEAGGGFAHAPVRLSTATLVNFIGAPNRFYIGAEAMADWARASPFLVVPEALFLTRLLGAPIRFGVGVPLTVGAKGNDGSYGCAFRFVIEPDE